MEDTQCENISKASLEDMMIARLKGKLMSKHVPDQFQYSSNGSSGWPMGTNEEGGKKTEEVACLNLHSKIIRLICCGKTFLGI